MHQRFSSMIAVVGLVFLFILGTGTAFGSGKAEKQAPSSAPSAKTAFKIGFSIHFERDDYGIFCVRGGKQEAAKYPGSKFIATDANGDPAKQLTDMENLIAQNVDAIVVVPMDEKAILPAIRKANERHIPVIAITKIPNAKVLATIRCNDYALGKESGDLLVKTLHGKGDIAVVDLPYSLWRIDQRVKGFEDALKGTNIKVVAKYASTSQAKIQNAVSNILVAHPNLAGVWASYSNQVVGAADALKAANRHIPLTGIDADRAIIARINQGWITGVAGQFPYWQGAQAVKIALDYLQGKKVKVSYSIPITMVTPANADQMLTKIWGKDQNPTLQQ